MRCIEHLPWLTYVSTLVYLGGQVWQSLLAVRTLVLPRTEDTETWLKFASLCRKSGRDRQARSTLVKLLQVEYLYPIL